MTFEAFPSSFYTSHCIEHVFHLSDIESTRSLYLPGHTTDTSSSIARTTIHLHVSYPKRRAKNIATWLSASVANHQLPHLVTPQRRNMQHLTSLHFTSLLPVSYHARLPQPVFTARTITCGRFEMTMAILHSHCHRRTCPSRAYSAAVSASPFGRVAFISAANIHLRPCLPGPCTVSLRTTSRQAAFHERDLT